MCKTLIHRMTELIMQEGNDDNSTGKTLKQCSGAIRATIRHPYSLFLNTYLLFSCVMQVLCDCGKSWKHTSGIHNLWNYV